MAESGEKAIFVSGGASGIGLAVAKLFAARGWRVGIADIDTAAIDRTRADFDAARTSFHAMDVRDPAAWEAALADFATTSGGRLDMFFKVGRVPIGGSFAATDLPTIDRAIAINFSGVVYGAHAAHQYLKATPGSAMLITSSAAGIYGTSGAAIYSATKFAVRGLAESLDGEWRPDDIRVRTLMPSFIETPLLEHGVTGSNQSIRESVTGAGLEITPVDQVAQAAWDAIHGDRVHTPVGKTARRLWFAARWTPGAIRKQMGKRLDRELRR